MSPSPTSVIFLIACRLNPKDLEDVNNKVIIIEYDNELFGFAVPDQTSNAYYLQADTATPSDAVPANLRPYVTGVISEVRNSAFQEKYDVVGENCSIVDPRAIIRDNAFVDIRTKNETSSLFV